MPIKRYKAEQIVTILRQIEVEIANGTLTSAFTLETTKGCSTTRATFS